MKDVRERLVKLTEGMYIERDVLNIVAKVQEYDPNLSVKVLASGGPGDAPYRLVERCRDGIERIVFDIWELDDRVLDRIKGADNARHNVLSTVEDKNKKERLDLNRRYQERMLEANDIFKTFLKSKTKSKWTVKDGDRIVTIEDR